MTNFRKSFVSTVLLQGVMVAFCIAVCVGCDDHTHGPDGHTHGKSHGNEGHSHDQKRDHARQGTHEHSSDHPPGHDHHASGHGHGGAAVVSFTLWGEHFELFGEYEAPVVGKATSFLLHLTHLKDFQALTDGKLTLKLTGPSELSATSNDAMRPGIYALSVTPTKPGTYRGVLEIAGADKDVITGLDMVVFATKKEAESSGKDEDDQGLIEFLKEQQWGVPFGTAFVETGAVTASVQVPGRIETPPEGNVEVDAPLVGRLVAPSKGLPRSGAKIKKGQLLAKLIPAPSSPEGAARAKLNVAEAQARSAAAKTALARAQRLSKDQAISAKELEDAVREAKLAAQAETAAQEAEALYAQARGGGGSGSWRLTAPISGTLVSVKAKPGATASPGEPLFHIVDTSEIWIVARVSEQDASGLKPKRNASYQLPGRKEWIPIEVEGEKPRASVVNVGQIVDRVARTVDVIYGLQFGKKKKPSAALRVGGLVQVSVPVGEEFKGVVVPTEAIIDQDGRMVVYVQVDGEHFQERMVRTSARSGGIVAITQGLKEGERVVTKGAHLIRLAERAGKGQGHGHIH
jgi:membrane fusion protein, heavy metal efflux system